MAKVYSWQVSENPTRYAYIIHPQQVNISDPEIYIGAELTGTMLERVKDWVDSEACTEKVYKDQFLKIQEACPNVKFESVERYLNVSADCDNLRGPSGVGINRIFLNEEKSTPQISTYTIEYDNGGNDEFQVINGKDGAPGRTGDKGTDGENGVSSKTIMIYKSGSSVKKPEGGSYNFETNEFTAPNGWDATNDSNLTPPVWMSSRTFTTNEKSTDKNWSNPIQITGEDGKPGADGTSIEFLYKLSNDKPDIFMLDSPENINGLKYEPPVDSGWTDSPTGISENNPTEWCTTRKTRKNESGITIWGPWEEPFIWSKYGVNGQDGDGVQYIFLKNSGTLPPNPTPNGYNDNTTTIYREYQNKDEEWIPLLNSTYENINGDKVENVVIDGTDDAGIWTDSPTDITQIFNSQWVCSRKYRKNDEGIKEWGPYSNPALWGKYGQDGKNATSIRKLYCLSDSTSNPPTLPSDSIITGDWGTGFPLDYVNGENVVWGTEAEIYADTNEFVMSYKMVSIKKSNDEIIHPNDVNYTNTYFADTLPDKEVYGYKYVQYNKMYYSWLGGWCEPYLVTGLKGEPGKQGEQGPAGKPGVAGIPGASSIQMYCLGTYGKNSDNNHYFDTYKNGVDKMGDGYFGSKNWQNDAFVEEMDGWFITQKIPFSDTIDVVTASDISNVASDEKNDGRVIKYTKVITQGNSVTKEIIYYLIQNKTTIQITSKLSESDDFNVYVWCIQGNEVWGRDKNNNNVITGIKWGQPFKVQGTNGLRGLTGKRGQVVYPMGVYNSEEVYVTTDDKAPYVYDPNDGLYYVYNTVNEPWVGILPDNYETIKNEDGTYKYSIDGSGDNDKWITSQNGDTPANNYANAVKNNYNPSWVRFESFQALYTSIGIIANGMIGSAVYNNEFMFSQQGIDEDGNKTNYAVTSGKDTEYGFLSGYEYDEEGETLVDGLKTGRHWKYKDTNIFIDNDDVNPYEMDGERPLHTFRPNVCINFETGQMWLSSGQIHFGANTRNVSTKKEVSDEITGKITEIDSKFTVANDEISGTVREITTNLDNLSKTVTESGFIVESDFANLFSEQIKDNKIVKAEVKTAVEEGIATVKITADKINFKGQTIINEQFIVDEDGDLTVKNADIVECDITSANITNADITNADITNAKITNVTIEGSIRSPFVLDTNEELTDTYHDNFAFQPYAESENSEYVKNLKWSQDQSGRRVTMVHHKWDDIMHTGCVRLSTPSFFNIAKSIRWFRVGSSNKYADDVKDLNLNYYETYRIENYHSTRSFPGSNEVLKIGIPKGNSYYTLYIKHSKHIPSGTTTETNNNNFVIISKANKSISTEIEEPNLNDENITSIFAIPTDVYTQVIIGPLDETKENTIEIVSRQLIPENSTYYTSVILPKNEEDKYYFYENGVPQTAISLSHEMVTLVGYGDDKRFYGWIVENRSLIETEKYYGGYLRFLLYGRIVYQNNTFVSNESFVRTATPIFGDIKMIRYETGKYQLLFNNILSFKLRDCTLITGGYGSVNNYSSKPCKATEMPFIEGKSSYEGYNTGFEIWVSDDDSLNDGSFYFYLINRNDFIFGS